ncbi:MAG: TetR/AcrR family transcriptional regulator [Acidimicrobiia bacterium]|nr:TetR/AcrR family transcriptional regulator [Acidimicrobiia bacterium]
MQNLIPQARAVGIAEEVAARTTSERTAAYADEVRRLLDAAYAVLRRTGELEPRVLDVVHESGLSNQAFYRHFRSKDELLLALLDDGQRRLVTTLAARMHRAEPGAPRVRAWVEGVLEQARRPEAAENTRPFVINGMRLAERFPVEWARSRDALLAPLADAIGDLGGDPERDAPAVYHLTFGAMQDALVRRARLTDTDVGYLVQCALAVVTISAEAQQE